MQTPSDGGKGGRPAQRIGIVEHRFDLVVQSRLASISTSTPSLEQGTVGPINTLGQCQEETLGLFEGQVPKG